MPTTAPTFQITRHNGRTVVLIDGQPRNLLMYSPPAMGRPDFDPVWRECVRRFAPHDMDVYLMSVPQRWEQKFTLDNFWDGDTISDTPLHLSLEKLDEGPNFVLEQDPEAFIMLRFQARPPESWYQLHPEQCVVLENGQRQRYPSLASELHNRLAADYCAAYIRFCESRPWAARCLGYINYHLCEGSHGPLCAGWLYDHSDLMTARWRRFLTERYDSDAALRKAYGDDTLSLETIAVPTDRLNGSRREVAELHYWQDEAENRPLRDWFLLQRELYYDLLKQQADASRVAAGSNRLLLHDTLKLPMQGWSNHGFFSMEESWPIVYPETAAGSGNMDVTRLLDLPSIDGVCTPYDYQVRGAGGIFEPEGIADSVALRGDKLFFIEQDIRTYAGKVYNCGMMRNLQEFAAVTWRDLTTALTRGFMNYLTDHNQDYYSDPPMHAVVDRQMQVLAESVNWPHATMPGIAMILDEQASLETNGSGHVMNEAVMWEEKMGLSRCGVPYRIYLLDDLLRDDFPMHRVFYFPNLYRVDDDRLALLREKVFRDGRVVVWGPGSGISDGHTISADHATRLTGFNFTFQKVNYQRRVQIGDFTHPITAGLPSDTIFGGATSYGPVLYPTDGRALGWAWSKFGGDDTGLALKEMDGWHSLFTTAVPLPASLWRGIARFAGAHVYCEENDVLIADSSIVALHSAKGGPRTLRLPAPRRVTNLISGALLSEYTAEIAFNVDAPDTRVFLLE
jgi:hypothetical protein